MILFVFLVGWGVWGLLWLRCTLTPFNRFIKWLEDHGEFSGVGANRLVDFQRENGGYQLLDLVQEHVTGLEGRENTKRFVYSVLRSCARAFGRLSQSSLSPQAPGILFS